MNYIIENEKLTLQYIPGNGAWTYQLIIPNTKNIKGKWGELKVSGTIDAQGNPIINVGDPLLSTDAINAEYLSSVLTDDGTWEYLNYRVKIPLVDTQYSLWQEYFISR